jgi:hypothetical protein
MSSLSFDLPVCFSSALSLVALYPSSNPLEVNIHSSADYSQEVSTHTESKKAVEDQSQ